MIYKFFHMVNGKIYSILQVLGLLTDILKTSKTLWSDLSWDMYLLAYFFFFF